MQMVTISQKTWDRLFEALTNELRLEQYEHTGCKCPTPVGERPVENMHRHMHYHIHRFKSSVEEA